MVSGAVPEFRRTEVFAAVDAPTGVAENAMLDGGKVAAGEVPVPLRVTTCGLPVALSVIETVAVRAPPAVGLNDAEIAHEALGARVAGASGQSFVWAKSLAFAPPTLMPVIDNAVAPLFVSVAVCAALVVPIR